MRSLFTSIIVMISIPVAVYPDNWPQWRGASGNGVSTETGLPTRWSKNDFAWKAPLIGLGVSSPIVWGDRVFVTSQLGQAELRPGSHPTLARGPEAAAEKPMGKGAAPEKGLYFLVEAFRRSDGSRLWEYRVPAEGKLAPLHQKHNLASPSPVTDGNLVYAWFGNGQLVAVNMEGKLVWQRHLGTEYSPFEIEWGHGSSPTLYRDLLVLLCDHIPASHLLALDKKTGKEKWKVDRGKGIRSYSTPTVVRGPGGDELIVNASERIDAYDPLTGRHLWFTGESNRFPIPVPSSENGILYASRGYRSGPFMAIRLGGKGDISKTHVQWLVPTGAPYVSSLVHYQGLIYMANDAGVASCFDARTGEKVWQSRMEGIFSASPVAGDGKVYFLSETGETIVLKAGREMQILARNELDERMVASPAISNGQIFIRTDAFLFCIAKKSIGSRDTGVEQQRYGFNELIALADVVVAVQVLSTDYTATASDGPMLAAARALKVVKGPLKDGQTFNFTETAWVGPAYQKGEYRILFLEKTKPTEFPGTTEWRILSNSLARTDFFIHKISVKVLSTDSLMSFLEELQGLKSIPKKVTFR